MDKFVQYSDLLIYRTEVWKSRLKCYNGIVAVVTVMFKLFLTLVFQNSEQAAWFSAVEMPLHVARFLRPYPIIPKKTGQEGDERVGSIQWGKCLSPHRPLICSPFAAICTLEIKDKMPLLLLFSQKWEDRCRLRITMINNHTIRATEVKSGANKYYSTRVTYAQKYLLVPE